MIPYYKDLSGLEELLRSLEGQHLLSHVVIVDDGSPAPLMKPEFSTCKITVLRLWDNLGVQRARNYGWWWLRTQSTLINKYILFCDQDITWKKNSFWKLHHALDTANLLDSKVAYSYSDYERCGVVKGTLVAGEFDEARLKEVNFISTMSLAYTRALPSPPFTEGHERLQDWDLWLKLLKSGRKGVYVKGALFSAFYKEGCISIRNEMDYRKWEKITRDRYVLCE